MRRELVRITDLDIESYDLLVGLIFQLNPTISAPTFEELSIRFKRDNLYVFVLKIDNRIVGTITLATYFLITGGRGWIEDVVVDDSLRGKGLGRYMMDYVIEFSKSLNINKIDLTSSPYRVAANGLYLSLGFSLRDTNVYRMELK